MAKVHQRWARQPSKSRVFQQCLQDHEILVYCVRCKGEYLLCQFQWFGSISVDLSFMHLGVYALSQLSKINDKTKKYLQSIALSGKYNVFNTSFYFAPSTPDNLAVAIRTTVLSSWFQANQSERTEMQRFSGFTSGAMPPEHGKSSLLLGKHGLKEFGMNWLEYCELLKQWSD